MNLWARTLRQLTVLAVALFFFSCEDETSILGFKNPVKKLKANYVDIPLQSSVFLMDSLRTVNLFTSGETSRLLVGKYQDDQFGEVSATAITQYFPANTTKALLKESAVFDSISVQLQFDFYNYGSTSATQQTISVHEVQKVINNVDSLNFHFNKTRTPYSSTPLGSKTFAISPEVFGKLNVADTVVTIRVPLQAELGQRIFASAMKYRTAQTLQDSAFVTGEFFKQFNGLAIVPVVGDKMIGFTPASGESRVIVHYHDSEADSLTLNLIMRVFSYNEITANRTGTELSMLTQYSQPIQPANKRFVQSGTGVLTTLDLQALYDFVDADSNAAMVINEAELHLGPAEASAFAPITSLSLRAMKGEGFLKKTVDPAINKPQHLADSASVTMYAGLLGVSGNTFTPLEPDGSIFTVSRMGTNDFYSGYLTLFTQAVFKKEPNKQRFRYFALHPETPAIGKTVNRTVFQKDNIKLRVYYTRPTQPLQ